MTGRVRTRVNSDEGRRRPLLFSRKRPRMRSCDCEIVLEGVNGRPQNGGELTRDGHGLIHTGDVG